MKQLILFLDYLDTKDGATDVPVIDGELQHQS
jgi:hypothetical protein